MTPPLHLCPSQGNFIVFDRKDRVGGTSWIDQANTTSRLQTEVGVYHLQHLQGIENGYFQGHIGSFFEQVMRK